MKIPRDRRILLLALTPVLLAAASEVPPAALQQSRQAAAAAMAEFRQALQTAIAAGGPVAGIAVCSERAPEIAARVSGQYGLELGRTSLRVRNPANAPDPFERQVLERFAAERRRGADPARLEHAEVVTTPGGPALRYLKAIPTGEVCLLCHGSELSPAVAERLETLYPEDQATGFAVGDIRGAFSVTRALE